MIFDTKRLRIRAARPSDPDVTMFYQLWTDPAVMKFVGFPNGLRITEDEIRRKIANEPPTPFDRKLVVERKEDNMRIGECKLGSPNADGVSETDVKLFPRFWNKGYGTEVKRGLVDYLFIHTTCRFIEASPNVNNIPSQKMQEAVGAEPVEEGIYHFPEHMRSYTEDVPYITYRLTRKTWYKTRSEAPFSITGRLVTLRTPLPKDVEDYHRWNDPDLPAWELDAPWFDDDLTGVIAELRGWLMTRTGPPYHRLEIDTVDGIHIGWVTVYIQNDDPHYSEFGIDICEEIYWGKGYGTEACRLWVDYVFMEFNLSRLGFSTWSGNQGMIGIGKRLGFTKEACIRNACEVHDRFHDRIKMGILRDEWLKEIHWR